MAHTVGKIAALAGVTVRTLHHYDEIGLLSPSGRTHAGYRRYGDADLERLQQILYYRELGFALEEIATLLDDPRADAARLGRIPERGDPRQRGHPHVTERPSPQAGRHRPAPVPSEL